MNSVILLLSLTNIVVGGVINNKLESCETEIEYYKNIIYNSNNVEYHFKCEDNNNKERSIVCDSYSHECKDEEKINKKVIIILSVIVLTLIGMFTIITIMTKMYKRNLYINNNESNDDDNILPEYSEIDITKSNVTTAVDSPDNGNGNPHLPTYEETMANSNDN